MPCIRYVAGCRHFYSRLRLCLHACLCVCECVRVLENTHVCVQSPQCVLNFLYLIHKYNIYKFTGVTLTAENNTVTWDVVADEEYARGQKLVIKQILLGAEAKDNEFNVVEVSATTTTRVIYQCVCEYARALVCMREAAFLFVCECVCVLW